MSLDHLPDPIFARELRRVLGLPAEASNTLTLAAAVEHAERLAAAQEKGAAAVLGALGFGLHFNQSVHHGLVDETDREPLAELYAHDEREALEVMSTRYEEAA